MLSHRPISQIRSSRGTQQWRRYMGKERQVGTVWIYVVLFVASGTMFALDIANHRFAQDVRQVLTDAASPILAAAAGGVRSVRGWASETRDIVNLSQEVELLRRENRQLRDWERRALELESRANRYEALLKIKPDPAGRAITARAIADVRTPFARSIIINSGAEDGIVEGSAVLGSEGFIGRVVSTGASSSRVLLITDLESRIAVHVGSGRHRAILAGTNGDEPTLLHVPVGAKLHDGDVVVTSGEARLLPAGLPVGLVRLAGNGVISVVPASDPRGVDFVRVIDYAVPVDVADGPPPLPAIFQDPAKLAGSLKDAPGATAEGGN